MSTRILVGDCRERLAELPDASVQCCVTSPPYFGLRDYGVAGQIGLEDTPDAFVAEMVAVFRDVRRVLRDDGTLWLNLGDSYSDTGRSAERRAKDASGVVRPTADKTCERCGASFVGGLSRRFCSAACGGSDNSRRAHRVGGLKHKDLIGIPWRVAFALQADGWWLRQDIIWSKLNPMPESVTDRCTKAHEYLFLLTKSATYHYDAAAIAEAVAPSTIERMSQPTLADQAGSDRVPGKTNGRMKAVPPRFGGSKYGDNDAEEHRTKSGNEYDLKNGKRNRRSVWTVATQPFSEAHFATFPPALIEPCILAGCPAGGTVLDPFGGAGTTGLVADRLGRNAILIELNPAYAAMAEKRLAGDAGLFASVAANDLRVLDRKDAQQSKLPL